MNINSINPVQINKVQFGNSQKPNQNVNTDGYAEKVPVNYDTARAYASYGINNRKDNVASVNNLSLAVKGCEGLNAENAALVSMLTVNDKPANAKEGVCEIRNAISDKYITALYSVGVDAVSLSNGSFVGVKCSPKNINSAITLANFLSSNAFLVNKEEFEDIKNDLKSYYKENFDSMKTSKEDEHFTYSEFKNAQSIDEVFEKIDNVSYSDYMKYCEDTLKMKDRAIAIDVPKDMLDNKQIDVKEIENHVLKNTSINGEYEFEVK